MKIPVLVINLDRSKDRWEALQARARAVGIEPERIPAVDGTAIDPAEWQDFQLRKFQLWHGRRPLAAEYGCYRSHIRALDQIVARGWPYAVVLEDDVALSSDFVPRIEALTKLDPGPAIVKLHTNRVKGFIPKARTQAGDTIGRCVHGPLGSAMGYLVSQSAAQTLRTALLPMYLPFDIALERGWSHRVPVAITRKPLLQPVKSNSTISPTGYRKTKFPFYMRIPAALFRGQDYLRRVLYAAVG